MLSISQKQSVFQAVKKSFVIGSKTFNTSVVYPGESFSYPYILLNYPNEANREQTAIGDYLGVSGSKGQRSSAFLSINIEAKDSQGMKKHDIASGIADLLFKDIRENWQSLASDTVHLKSISNIRNLTYVNMAAGVYDLTRLEFDVRLYYTISW